MFLLFQQHEWELTLHLNRHTKEKDEISIAWIGNIHFSEIKKKQKNNKIKNKNKINIL